MVPEQWWLVFSINPMVGVINGSRWCILRVQGGLHAPGFLTSIAVIVLSGGFVRVNSAGPKKALPTFILARSGHVGKSDHCRKSVQTLRIVSEFSHINFSNQFQLGVLMWQVRFGNHSTWVADIARTVDYTRFACSFGNLDRVDLTDFDCVVPLSIEDYDTLRSKLAYRGTKFWFPRPEVASICNDKLLLNRWLLGTEFAELVPPLTQNNGMQFPYILKKRVDVFGKNSFVIRNHKDESAMATLLQSPDYFCQTYVPGTEEFALHLLVVNDQVVYDQTVKYEFRQRTFTKGLGHWPKRRIYLPTSNHVMTFARILVKLGYQGTCCIDYKTDGRALKLLEINPRFGATLARDVNRYLEAYLGSLGIMDKSEFRCHGIPPVQDNFKQRTRHRLRSYTQPWMRKLRKSARSIRDYLRSADIRVACRETASNQRPAGIAEN